MAAHTFKTFVKKMFFHLSLLYLASLTLRVAVSKWGHSGEGMPPLFGDFEAQRHWMEVTVNLPIEEWYVDTSDNDLQYWGLDYPPLTAYHMMLNGKIAQYVNSSFVELHKSRGIEGQEIKFFMRASVFAMDAFLFLPSVALFFIFKRQGHKDEVNVLKNIIVLFAYPGLLLVDNGHFQYNNVSLGLMILAVCALTLRMDLVSAAIFCLALNYKQMELYHAIPFFAYLLGTCLNHPQTSKGIYKLTMLSLIVIITFIIIWSPFLDSIESTKAVLLRLFPVKRGLYEDKVANVWCAMSVIIKFKEIFYQNTMALICLITTAMLLLPSFFNLLRHSTLRNFHYALVNSSLIFFLFSFHVHEKSILLATIPACLLIQTDNFVVLWFLLISVFSMFPLLVKDGLLIPTIAVTLLFWCIANYYHEPLSKIKRRFKFILQVSILGAAVLSLTFLFIRPPERYPDLFQLLIAIYSCAHFILYTFYFHGRQFEILTDEFLIERQSNNKDDCPSSDESDVSFDQSNDNSPTKIRKRYVNNSTKKRK